MKIKKRINVTQRDLDLGVKADPCKCAVARPLKRLFPGAHVSAWRTLYVYPGGMPLDARTPVDIFETMNRWDQDLPVKPFSFTVEFSDGCPDE